MTWRRLEAGSLDADMIEGVQAQVADPLWLLARQFQVGEFHAENAASPVLVEATIASTPMTAYATADGATAPRLRPDGAMTPLETLVEAESPAQGPEAIRLTVELGWLLLRELKRRRIAGAIVEALRKRFPPPELGPDLAAADAATRLLATRSVDGWAIVEAVVSDGAEAVAATLGATGGALANARNALMSWHRAAVMVVAETADGPAWSDRTLGYGYRLGGPTDAGELQLEARDYDGRALDWHHHDVARGRRKKLEPAGRSTQRTHLVLPTPLRYSGMPASRFWEMEDRAVDFDKLVGGPDDLARSVVSGFAATYGDDWMVVPHVAPVGTVLRVLSVKVLDDFGAVTDIRSAAELDGPGRVWRYFELGGDRGPDARRLADRVAPLLFVSPSLVDRQHGPIVETVDFVRDEEANLAWAIERRVQTAAGRSVDRDADSAPSAPIGLPEGGEPWRYVGFAPPPQHFIPLIPVEQSKGQPVLRRGRVEVADGDPETTLPRGEILHRSRPLWVLDSAIPEAGTRVVRRWQRARDGTGRPYLWLGRSVADGAPAVSETASFDELYRAYDGADDKPR